MTFPRPALLQALAGRHSLGPKHLGAPAPGQAQLAGAALMNMLNGLRLQGDGAKVLSGPSVRGAQIQTAFCAEGESLAAWILAGTPLQPPLPRARPDAAPVLSVWH